MLTASAAAAVRGSARHGRICGGNGGAAYVMAVEEQEVLLSSGGLGNANAPSGEVIREPACRCVVSLYAGEEHSDVGEPNPPSPPA